ncbi:MAG: phage baseplate assembly protein V [Desulfobacteraceae bacterium]|nr:phage baseplate assembly protein V [Desulfobacteraceae bacterium]
MKNLDFIISDINRRLANLVRLGVICEIDAGSARAKVKFSEIVTDWLPWISCRAGDDIQWWAPVIGEQVVILSPSGELSIGVIIPSIYSSANPANADSTMVHRTTYSDGTIIEYDKEKHKASINCTGDVEVKAKGSIRLESPSILIEGNLTVNGELNAGSVTANGISLAKHVHSGVLNGGGITGVPQ